MILIERSLSSRVGKDFDIQIMKRIVIRNGINHSKFRSTKQRKFRRRSRHRIASFKSRFRPFEPTKTQTSQQERKSARDADSERDINQGGSSSASAPSTAGPAPKRIGSSEASQDGLRPAAPGIPSGIRPAATPGTSASVAPTMTSNQATPSPAPTAIPTATPSASTSAAPGTTPSASPNPLTR